MNSFMKKCMGSIIYVPGCDGSNNNTSKNKPKRDQTNQKLICLMGGVTIAAGGVKPSPRDSFCGSNSLMSCRHNSQPFRFGTILAMFKGLPLQSTNKLAKIAYKVLPSCFMPSSAPFLQGCGSPTTISNNSGYASFTKLW